MTLSSDKRTCALPEMAGGDKTFGQRLPPACGAAPMSVSCQGGVLASWACVHMTVEANKAIVNHEVLIKLKKKSEVMDEPGKQPLKRQPHSPSEKRISRLPKSRCPRSEERRVGKECRSRWSPNQ